MSNRAQENVNIFIVIIGLMLLALTAYIGYRISISEHKILSISLIALVGGVLFESFRVTDKWTYVCYIFIGAFIISLFAFLPGKEQNYSFESHLELWPYFFLFIFAFASAIFHQERTTVKLTEGITLLQSLSIIYWVIDYGFWNIDSWFLKSLLIIALLFSLFSIFNALTHFILSRTTRLTLSIWSSIIMMLFAIDYIIRVHQNSSIETNEYLSDELYIGLEFFLLGVSVIYSIQNFIMLMGFFPGKGSFFNRRYFIEISELKDNHINRYSDQQVPIGHSILCIIVTGTIYWLNYKYQFLPRHTAVWLAFIFLPLLLALTNYGKKRREYRYPS